MTRSRIFFLMIVVLVQTATSQPSKHPVLWRAYISAGYAHAVSNDLEQYYNSILDSYHSAGVPVPTQVPLGRTVMVNGGVLMTRIESVWLGLCAGYSYSPAYSNYRDYAGTLKVTGAVKSYEVSLKLKGILDRIMGLPLTVSIQPGAAYVSAALSQELRFSDLSGQNQDRTWSASAWGPFFQATLGVSQPVGNFIVSLEGGYKHSWNSTKEDSPSSTSAAGRSVGSKDIGPTGALVLLSFEVPL